MKILITGGEGQLGGALRQALQEGKTALGGLPKAYQGYSLESVDLPAHDLSDLGHTLSLVRTLSPEVIFHCAAFTQVDRCEAEPEAAFRANALAARNVAMAAQEAGAKLVHVSTDYVFDGTATAPIPEWTLPNPRSVYGHSKLLGEQYVREFSRRYFLLRTAWLYGGSGGNFVQTMLRLARERGEVTVVDDQVGCPTHAWDLAHHMLALAATDEFGVYHVTGKGACSWYEFAREILRLSGIPCEVKPCSTGEYLAGKTGIAPRPAYSVLADHMLRATVGNLMRPWEEALADYMRQCAQPRAPKA